MLLSVLFSVKNILPQVLLLVLFMCPISFYNQPRAVFSLDRAVSACFSFASVLKFFTVSIKRTRTDVCPVLPYVGEWCRG